MRSLILFLCLISSLAQAFTLEFWDRFSSSNPPTVYTNLIGRELVGEILLRSRWTGDTNWMFTNSVTVTYDWSNSVTDRVFTNGTNIFTLSLTNTYPMQTNLVVTNVFGDSFVQEVAGNSVTGVIPFTTTGAEQLTAKAETTVLPSFVLPYYSTTPDFSFDSWFAHELDGVTGMNRWPGLTHSKADLMYHYPETGITVMKDNLGSNIVSLAVAVNTIGEVVPDVIEYVPVSPVGYWTKRRDRIDPLIVAEWKQYNATYTYEDILHTNNWQYYTGWPNEFADGSSQLFGLVPEQYPIYRVHLGGTNTYSGAPSLNLERNIEPYRPWELPWYWFYTMYTGGGLLMNQLTSTAEWVTNRLVVKQYEYWEGVEPTPRDEMPIIPIVDGGRSDRAWVALGFPLMLTGTSPNTWHRTNVVAGVTNIIAGSGDTVSLQYTNRMNTYEGTKVWDNVLLPEQLTAHYVALTNKFLMPWTQFGWTNSQSFDYTTNIGVGMATGSVFDLEITGTALDTWGHSPNGVYGRTGSAESWYKPDVAHETVGYIGRAGEAYNLTMVYYGWLPSTWQSTNGMTGPYYLLPGNYGVSGVATAQVVGVNSFSATWTTNLPPWPDEPTTSNLWWWIKSSDFPLVPDPFTIQNGEPAYLSNAVAPTVSFTCTASGIFTQQCVYHTYITDGSGIDTNNYLGTNYDWFAEAVRHETPITIEATGAGIVSSMLITNLYTGTPHRAHLYVRTANTNSEQLGPSRYYHRLGIYPEEFTTNDSIVTEAIDPRIIKDYALSFKTTNTTGWVETLIYSDWRLEPYVDLSQVDTGGVSVSSTTVTQSLVSVSSNLIASGVLTNIGGTYYKLDLYEPVFNNVVTTNILDSFVVAGWVYTHDQYYWDIYLGKAPDLDAVPEPYSASAFKASFPRIETYTTNAVGGGTPSEYTDPYKAWVEGAGDVGMNGEYESTNGASYTDGSSHLEVVAGSWWLIDQNGMGIYYTAEPTPFTGGWLTAETNAWAEPAPIVYCCASLLAEGTNTLYTGTDDTSGYEVGDLDLFIYDPDNAWNDYHWYNDGYIARTTPWEHVITVPQTVPEVILDKLSALRKEYMVREWMPFSTTNWSNSVEFKVLIEWEK